MSLLQLFLFVEAQCLNRPYEMAEYERSAVMFKIPQRTVTRWCISWSGAEGSEEQKRSLRHFRTCGHVRERGCMHYSAEAPKRRPRQTPATMNNDTLQSHSLCRLLICDEIIPTFMFQRGMRNEKHEIDIS